MHIILFISSIFLLQITNITNNMANEALITQFYTAFAKADAETMVSCYGNDIDFEDPAFGKLHGDDARNMWRMLLESSKGNLKITFDKVQADERTGSANWVAEYVFSQTGRKVINKVSAKFEFAEGKITKHTDTFDMWRWSRQALGVSGYLMGWSGYLRRKVQQNTHHLLQKYTAKK
jgi:ketosteroid isomerase-like protein